MDIFSTTLALFLLMDSIGNIPLYISLLKDLPPKRQYFVIIREMLIALVIIVFFYAVGDYLLDLLKVKQYSVQMAGGVILFLISLKMIFPSSADKTTPLIQEEPFIVPLAVPFVAGPAILAVVMIYSNQVHSSFVLLLSIFLAWGLSLLILLASPFFQRILGKKGISACEKLMGLILTLLGIEMLMEGISLFVKIACKS